MNVDGDVLKYLYDRVGGLQPNSVVDIGCDDYTIGNILRLTLDVSKGNLTFASNRHIIDGVISDNDNLTPFHRMIYNKVYPGNRQVQVISSFNDIYNLGVIFNTTNVDTKTQLIRAAKARCKMLIVIFDIHTEMNFAEELRSITKASHTFENYHVAELI